MKKNSKLVFLIVMAAIALVAAALLWLPNITIDGNTPEWLVDASARTADFVDSLNSTVIIIVGLIALGAFFFYQKALNKNNKTGLTLLVVLAFGFGLYVLVFPGLALAFPETTWLVDFSTFAIDTSNFITDYAGMLTLAGFSGVLIYVVYKKK